MKTRNSIEEEHKCSSFVLLIGKNPAIKRFVSNLPSKVEPFIGRNEDVRNALQALIKTRLVTITGEPGIGKTSVAKAVIHYINDRNDEGSNRVISFLAMESCSSLFQLFHKFVLTFEETTGIKIVYKSEKKDSVDMFKEVLKFISNHDILLVIDNAENLMDVDKDILKKFLDTLFESSIKIKVILTSKIEPVSYFGGINGVQDRVIKLKPLSNIAAEKLLCEKAGKLIPKDDKAALQKREPERVHSGIKNAYQHMFEQLLGGHPIAISLAASLFKYTPINALYEKLIKSATLNTLTEGTAGKTNVTQSLYHSLDLSLRLFNDKKIYDFLNMMGFLPGGVREEDINYIWREFNKPNIIEWATYSNYLENASIIIKKKVKFNKDSVEVYHLVPMLKNVAEEIRDAETRKKLHKIVTRYYIKILNEILEENSVSKVSKENEIIMNNLWFFETNIWD